MQPRVVAECEDPLLFALTCRRDPYADVGEEDQSAISIVQMGLSLRMVMRVTTEWLS
jgi:hypothetical protein